MNLIRRAIRNLIRMIKPKRLCNICNREFRGKFNPIPKIYMENAKRTGYPFSLDDGETLNYREYTCPYCFSSDRDRLYALYLEKYLDRHKTYYILDIAPQNGLRKYLKAKNYIRYRSADLFMEDVDDNIDIMDMSIYEDCHFDIFICSHVLEHVLDDIKAMKELFRILKSSGFGICMVPIVLPVKSIEEDINITDPDERMRRYGQDDHVRIYSKEGYKERLKKTGFRVEEVTVKDFSLKEFTLHGISAKSVLYIVRK